MAMSQTSDQEPVWFRILNQDPNQGTDWDWWISTRCGTNYKPYEIKVPTQVTSYNSHILSNISFWYKQNPTQGSNKRFWYNPILEFVYTYCTSTPKLEIIGS